MVLLKRRGRVVLVVNIGVMFVPFKAISFGFTFGDEDVDEDNGTVALEVSVISGTLQRSVDIAYSTVEVATRNAAKSKMVMSCTFYATVRHLILCL